VNVKYGQLKDKNKYKGYDQIKVRSVPFSDLDFNKKTNAGFLKKASYIGTHDGKQTSIITDPDSNDVFGRFSGGSGVFYFKEPKTGKTLSMDVSGSVNTIKAVGEEISKKYGVDPKNLQFLYHDMGSYSAKPKSHNGVLSNQQWQNYNVNNKGYSGAALMYPMEYGGQVVMENGGYAEIGYDVPEYYNAINNERPRDSATSYQQDVKGKFNWSNTLSKIPIEQIQKDIDSIPLTKNYMLNKTPKGYFNVYDKNNKPLGYSIDGKTLVPQEPNFEDGGLVRAWIQKFIKGGYIAGGGFPYKIKNLFKTQSQITPAVELNQGQTNSFFWNLNNQKVDSPYSNYKQFNVDPNQANTELDYNVAKKVTGNNIPMNNIPGKIDPTMILGSIGAAGDAITQGGSAIASMAGDETSAKALQKAGAIGKVAESFGNIVPIPGVGKALGAVTSIFAAPFTAWGEQIAKNEINKAEQQVNFFNRNTPGIWQPSYYGQTYSKYGSNIKNLEQRIMDDIYSDFDKYMKLT